MSDDGDRARDSLEEIASQFYTQAASCHIKGMTLSATYARISQFAAIGSDTEVAEYLRLLEAEGVVMLVEGKYVVLEQGEPSAQLDIRITSQGGDS